MEIAANVAVSQFGDIRKATLSITKELDLVPGVNSTAAAKEADKFRIKFANKRALSAILETRIAKRERNKRENENNLITEGAFYASGAFLTIKKELTVNF